MVLLAESAVPKAASGVRGLDDVTGGGLPAGRATFVFGAAGCGKTLLAVEFLVHGFEACGEPGALLTFEESAQDIAANARSLGLDLVDLQARGGLAVDHVDLGALPTAEAGHYDLSGLFFRLEQLVGRVGARRLVIDSIDSLLTMFENQRVVRSEFRRLLRWCRERTITVVVTGEGSATSALGGRMQEYVSDCVIALDHRVNDQISTRRLRVVKYRGSAHGTNEYPFLIDDRGLRVLPITSAALDHQASSERVSTGIAGLDGMLGGLGVFRGTTVLVSGTAGSGKTSIAAHFALAACERGERTVVLLFEESPSQWQRNLRSIGLDFGGFEARGLLRFHAARPSVQGLEMHLAVSLNLIGEFAPRVVVIDPVSAFDSIGSLLQVKAMLVRLVDFLKQAGITAVMTDLTRESDVQERTAQEISSVVDTWLLLRDTEAGGERNRCIYILKSRGMAHSNQVREFRLTSQGAVLEDVYIGGGEVLTGAARAAQVARDIAARAELAAEVERHTLALRQRREALERRVEALRAEAAADELEAERGLLAAQRRLDAMADDERSMGVRRQDPRAP